MRWTANTTTMRERSRRASPLADYSWLLVDAGSDQETRRAAQAACVFRGYVSYESTHRAAAHRAGLGCLDEKIAT